MLDGITTDMTGINLLSLVIVIVIGLMQAKMLLLVRQNTTDTLTLKNKVFQLVTLLQSERLKKRRIQRSKELVEKTVNDGSLAVEAVHQTIAGVTFDVIDALAGKEAIRANTRKLRDIHDQTAGGVYRSVREVNKQLSGLADTLLNAGKKPRDRQE